MLCCLVSSRLGRVGMAQLHGLAQSGRTQWKDEGVVEDVGHTEAHKATRQTPRRVHHGTAMFLWHSRRVPNQTLYNKLCSSSVAQGKRPSTTNM